ncbi:protein kinase [Ruania alkalisoli]|uniref:non-specific serine/threonine protein kinase n=1 Tax=Ruania alkalisoli TaxID=2779775 RepID=A0A7M1SR14_9MICO|nr:serine/threonine-protein kinase [Ruania alkalisoli]QOR69915.1 protein kinase [Ruania alkalisoli]
MTDLDAPTIPGFQLLRPLGHGGFSDVYLYQQQMPRRDVAIKVLRTDSLTRDARARFAAEAHLMARLSGHTGIADVLAADVDADGEPYLVMEYCPGGSLGEVYRTQSMNVPEVLRLGVRLACALESAHQQGIVHRDVKPANILLTEYGMAVLADFGISTIDDAFPEARTTRLELDMHDHTSSAVGMSLPWAAPEALASPPVSDARSDQYGLTATLYSLLEGRSPHEIPDGPNGSAHLTGRIRSGFVAAMARTDVPPSLEDVLRTGMAHAPSDRFDSCLDLALALQEVQRELGAGVTALEVPRGVGQDLLRLAAADPAPTQIPDGVPSPAAPVTETEGAPGTRLPVAAPGESTWLPGEDAAAAGTPGSAARDNPAQGISAPGEGEELREEAPPSGALSSGRWRAGPATLTPMVPTDLPTDDSPAARTAGRVALIAGVAFVVLALVAGASILVDWFSVPHFSGRTVDNLEVRLTSAGAYDVTVPEGLAPPDEVQSRVVAAVPGPALDEGDTVLLSLDAEVWAQGGTVVLNPHEGEATGTLIEVEAGALRDGLDLAEPVTPGLVVLAAAPEAYFVNVAPELGIAASESTLVLVHVIEE